MTIKSRSAGPLEQGMWSTERAEHELGVNGRKPDSKQSFV